MMETVGYRKKAGIKSCSHYYRHLTAFITEDNNGNKPPPMLQQPLVGEGLLMIEAWQSHSDTSHLAGLIWISDQPDTEASTWQQHNTHCRETSTPPARFKTAILASEQPQTHALDHAATGIGNKNITAFFSHRISPHRWLLFPYTLKRCVCLAAVHNTKPVS